ncbi:MAG: spore coat protein CotD [Bacillaceae bacterium]|nr:spore coat protein CotD [Bacillaceae bacterium]
MRPHGRPCVPPCNPIVYPTKHNVKNNVIPHEVDHIHPSHTTVMNHHVVHNKHYYPHTASVGSTCSNVHYNMGPGPQFPYGAGYPMGRR